MPDSFTVPTCRFRPGGLNCRFVHRFWLVGLAGQTRIASVGAVLRGTLSLIRRKGITLRLPASDLVLLCSIRRLPRSRGSSIFQLNTYAIDWRLFTFMTGQRAAREILARL